MKHMDKQKIKVINEGNIIKVLMQKEDDEIGYIKGTR
jgi:hypothetical protein